MDDTRISHYRIVQKLGEGGMGVVYKAIDERLGRPVALKVLKESFSDRFEREARAISALSHPNIATLYDVGSHEGSPYLVMEFVDGAIPRGPLPVKEAVEYAAQIAGALAAAHAAGIVHRDLKPGNVLVTRKGTVKVLDFGLAKRLHPAGETETFTASISGTRGYMAPEQVEGKPADARSDIFSFGCVLYELLSGRSAFRPDTITSVVTDEAAPLDGLPHIVAWTLARCLNKDPDERWQSIADVKMALEEARASASVSAPAGQTPRRKAAWLLLGGLLCVSLGSALAVLLRQPAPMEPGLTVKPLTSFRGSEIEPAISPDGNYVAFSWGGESGTNNDIWLQMIGHGVPLRLTTDAAFDYSPAWSPDGKDIAFLRALPGGGSRILIVPALGGVERPVSDVPTNFGPHGWDGPELTWCPNGECFIAASRGESAPSGLIRVSLADGSKTDVTTNPPGMLGDTAPSFSPDGTLLAFRRIVAYHLSDICLLPVARDATPAGEVRRLSTGGFAMSPAWAPGGREVIYVEGPWGSARLWRVEAREGATPRPILPGDEGALYPSVSASARAASSRLVYARWTWDLNVWEMPLAPGGRPELRIGTTRRESAAEFSPDGNRVVFVSDQSGQYEAWTCRRDGSQMLRLTDLGSVQQPRWTPDGTSVLLSSAASGQQEIYVVNADGGSPPRRLTNHRAIDWAPAMSADGKHIYFSSDRSGRWEIWRMPSSGGEAVQFTHEGGLGSRLSGDGEWVYFTRPAAPYPSLWRRSTAKGTEERIAQQIRSIWTYDVVGSAVYYLAPPPSHGEPAPLVRLDLKSGAVRTVALFPQPQGQGFSVSPDERSALYDRTDTDNTDLKYVDGFR